MRVCVYIYMDFTLSSVDRISSCLRKGVIFLRCDKRKNVYTNCTLLTTHTHTYAHTMKKNKGTGEEEENNIA